MAKIVEPSGPVTTVGELIDALSGHEPDMPLRCLEDALHVYRLEPAADETWDDARGAVCVADYEVWVYESQ